MKKLQVWGSLNQQTSRETAKLFYPEKSRISLVECLPKVQAKNNETFSKDNRSWCWVENASTPGRLRVRIFVPLIV